MRMKRLICLLLCLCMLTSPVLAMDAVNEDKTFSDTQDHWAKEYIDVCWQTGLMEGVSEDTFDTEGKLTVAQCAAAAARLHARLNGTAEPQKGEPWYAGYVRYMEKLGLVLISDVNSECTRQQFFTMMDLVVPKKGMTDINEINVLPDTKDESILRFYRAGILTGMDEYGTFRGRLPLTRAECAAMMARIAEPGLRVKFRPQRTDGSAAMDCLYIPAKETALTIGGYKITAELFTAVLDTKLEVQEGYAQLITYPEYEEFLDKWLSSAYASDFEQFLEEYCGKGDYAQVDWYAVNEETGKSYAQTAYDDTMDWLYEHAALRSAAEKYKLKLTSQQKTKIEDYLDKYKVKGANRKIYVTASLEDKYLLEALYEERKVSDNQINSLIAKGEHLCAEYICFLKTDKAGNALSEAEIDYIRHGAELYLAELKENPVGHYYFYRQTKYLECAYEEPRATIVSKDDVDELLWLKLKNLWPEGLSEVMETEDGIYIYLVDNPLANDALMEEVCLNYGVDLVNKELNSFVSSARLQVTDALKYLDSAEYAEKTFN